MIVTVLPVPAFALLKAPVYVPENVSPLIKPLYKIDDVFNGTYTGAFSDKNVGTGKTVTFSSSYTGADVGNYSVTDQTSTTVSYTHLTLPTSSRV